MGKREFISHRYSNWQELEELLERVRKSGIGSLKEDELMRLGALYRSASSDLAKARSVEPFGDVTSYLNTLVANVHAIIYSSEVKPIRGVKNFFIRDFPRMVRKHAMLSLLSAFIFTFAFFLGFFWMKYSPEIIEQVFPSYTSVIQEVEEQNRDKPSLLAPGTITEESMPEFSSYIMTNNIRVALLAFASGITFGLGTIYLLVMNGVLLGGVAFVYFSASSEHAFYFIAGVLPHAVLELPAIILSGAAGLIIASAMITPGNLTRSDSLRLRGREALMIMYGVVVILVIAGLIEGFITPIKSENFQFSVDLIKINFAVAVFIALIIYLAIAGRNTIDIIERDKRMD